MTDISVFDEPQPTGDLSSVLTLASELVQTESQIKDLEQLLKQLSGRATELKTRLLPDKMAEIGLSSFEMPDGTKIKVEDWVAGSLPKHPAKRDKAISKVIEMGGETIIQNELLLSFERSQHNEAMALADDLRQKGFDVQVTSDIHHQRLLGFVRERLRNGEEVDADALGIFVGRKTKVELAK